MVIRIIDIGNVSNKKVYVAGASGYIGRNAVKHLRDSGYEVIALSRVDPSIDNVEWINCNLLNKVDLERLNLHGATVINCAGAVDLEMEYKDFYINYRGAANLAEMIGPSGKLIHISCSSVYDLTRHAVETKEEDFDYHKYSHPHEYSRSKSLAEYLLQHRNFSLTPIIVLRAYKVYGRDDSTLLPKLISRVRWSRRGDRGTISLPNSGHEIQSLTHIDNLVEAIRLAVEYRTDDIFTAFNISDENSVSLSYAIEAYMRRDFPDLSVLKFVGPVVSNLRASYDRLPRKFSRYEILTIGNSHISNIQKAKKLLGYAPEQFKVL